MRTDFRRDGGELRPYCDGRRIDIAGICDGEQFSGLGHCLVRCDECSRRSPNELLLFPIKL
jgi:hypothetical protein